MRFRGIVYRAHNPQWSWTPLSGEGARRHGGRFNRRGIQAFYSSLSPVTAIREAQPVGRPLQPLTLCAYDVDAEPVFDATDEAQLRSVHADYSDLACATWEADMLAGLRPSKKHDRHTAREMQRDCKAKPRSRKLGGRTPASQALADRLAAHGYVGMLVRSFAVGAQADEANLVMWRWGDQHPIRVELIDDEGRLRTR